jgi:hypothetical protein
MAVVASLAVANAAAQSPAVVQVVIKAPPTESIEEIKDKFTQAAKRTGGEFNCDDIVIERVEPRVFDLLNSIVIRGAEAVRELREAGDREGIERVPGETNAWIVSLGDAALIDSATVGVVGSGDAVATENVEVIIGEPAAQGITIQGHSPGRYVVRVPAGVRPLRLRCRPLSLAGEERDFEAEFPSISTGDAYVVTLNGVKGSTSSLFEALKDKTKVANPILEMGDVPLIVANFVPRNVVDPNMIEIIDGQLRFSQPVDGNVNPKRLWLFFAATNADRDAEKQRVTGEGFQRIPTLIRDKRADVAASGAGLNATGGWVEITPLVRSPRGDGRFEVLVKLDVPVWQTAMQNAASEASEAALMVYEFDDGADQRPIKVGEDFVVTKKLPRFVRAILDAK